MPDRRLGHARLCARSSRTASTAACFPFFDQAALVESVRATLAEPEGSARLAEAARRKAVEEYDFRTVCLPQWRRFLGVPGPGLTARWRA